jgi:hypothetical protein
VHDLGGSVLWEIFEGVISGGLSFDANGLGRLHTVLQDGHEEMALKEGQKVQSSLAIGDVVTAYSMDFAAVPFETTTIASTHASCHCL